MDLDFDGIRALVTGGSAGIGLATAELPDRRGRPGRDRVAQPRARGRRGSARSPSPPTSRRRRVQRPRSPRRSRRWAAWTCSSTTSASPGSRTLEQVDDAEWQAAWDTNVMSYVRCIRAALPHLRDSAARRHRERRVDVGKAAQRRHARLLGDEGRRAVAVAAGGRRPRRRRHPLQRRLPRPDAARRPGWRPAGWPTRPPPCPAETATRCSSRSAAGRPLGRMAEPDEIAAVIAFLCSPRSSYVTGAAWSADGGTVPVII